MTPKWWKWCNRMKRVLITNSKLTMRRKSKKLMKRGLLWFSLTSLTRLRPSETFVSLLIRGLAWCWLNPKIRKSCLTSTIWCVWQTRRSLGSSLNWSDQLRARCIQFSSILSLLKNYPKSTFQRVQPRQPSIFWDSICTAGRHFW